MNLHQFYKEHYFFEASRRHQLTSALGLPTGIVIFLVGALTVLVNELATPFRAAEIVQLSFVVLSGVSMMVTVVFLFKSYFNYTYSYIATPKELRNHLIDLVAYHKRNGGTKSDAETELEEYINAEYANHTDTNTVNNDRKSSYIHKANGYLIASVVFVFFAGLISVLTSLDGVADTQKIEIVNFPHYQKELLDMPQEQEPKPQPQPEPTQPPPVERPTPPPGRLIKEGEVPEKREE